MFGLQSPNRYSTQLVSERKANHVSTQKTAVCCRCRPNTWRSLRRYHSKHCLKNKEYGTIQQVYCLQQVGVRKDSLFCRQENRVFRPHTCRVLRGWYSHYELDDIQMLRPYKWSQFRYLCAYVTAVQQYRVDHKRGPQTHDHNSVKS